MTAPMAQFGEGALLLLLLAAPAAAVVSLWLLRWRARQAGRLLGRGGGDVLTGASPSRAGWRFGLLALIVALLAVAIARPQFGERTRELEQEGIALVVALDVSLSMAAEDAGPNRLRAAQAELSSLLDRLSGDRVGLVIFAGEALTRFPLTRDLGTARDLINAMQPGERLVAPGSDVAAAIGQALVLLETTPADTRAILVVGDGESLSGDALAAAEAAAARGVHLFTAGVGSAAGATIPVRNRNTLQIVPKVDSATGDVVITRLDADALGALAAAGTGRFVRLDQPGSLAGLAGDLEALEASTFRVTTERSPIDRFQIPLAIALALLFLQPLIATRASRPPAPAPTSDEASDGASANAQPGRGRLRRRWLLGGLLPVIALLLAACSSASADRNAEANRAYDEQRFEEAADLYATALAQDPGNATLALNLGRALHQLGEFEAAIDATRRALNTPDDALAARAFYQLGNHQFDLPDLPGARSAFIESLLLDPTDVDAKINLEIVNTLLAAQSPVPLDDPGAGAGAGDDQGDGQGNGQADGDGESDGAPSAPSDTAPGRPAGRAPVAGDDDAPARSDAETGLNDAIDAFDRDNPTAAEALAILEALRTLQEAEAGGSGILPVEVAGEDDY